MSFYGNNGDEGEGGDNEMDTQDRDSVGIRQIVFTII